MLALDHIIIASKNPKEAAAIFEKEYQGIALEGGRHKTWGTYNYLAYFKNGSYIEWLGMYDEEIAKKSDNPLIHKLHQAFQKRIEGPIQIAFRTSKMDEYIRYFNENSILYKGPIPGSRKKPDGKTLNWRMLFPQTEDKYPLPFLIEWGEVNNFPNDKNLINPKDIHQIQLPAQKETLQRIYQFHFEGNMAELVNTVLRCEEEGIDYTINF